MPFRKILIAGFLSLIASMAIADPAPHPMPWFQVTQMFVSPLQVRMWGPNTLTDQQPWTGLYFRGGDLPDPYPSPELQSFVPYTVDLTPFGVGGDATVAFLSGILIITNASKADLAEIRFTVAPHSDPPSLDCTKYVGQAVTAIGGEGIRSTMATFVPLNQGKFDFCIIKGPNGVNTPKITYGINLTLQMWGR